MHFTCDKNINYKGIVFRNNRFVCSEIEYPKLKRLLSGYNPDIQIRGNNGQVVNKKKAKKSKAKEVKHETKKYGKNLQKDV